MSGAFVAGIERVPVRATRSTMKARRRSPRAGVASAPSEGRRPARGVKRAAAAALQESTAPETPQRPRRRASTASSQGTHGGDSHDGSTAARPTRRSTRRPAAAQHNTHPGTDAAQGSAVSTASSGDAAAKPDGDEDTVAARTLRRGSRYQGVKRHHGVFQAGIYANGSFFNLGEFETEEAAARAYDKAALRYHRHSAKLNFPDEHSDEDEHNEVCEVCDTGGHVICCETCNLVYHTHCLKPPLAVVPAAAWYCPVCTLERKAGPVTCPQCGLRNISTLEDLQPHMEATCTHHRFRHLRGEGFQAALLAYVAARKEKAALRKAAAGDGAVATPPRPKSRGKNRKVVVVDTSSDDSDSDVDMESDGGGDDDDGGDDGDQASTASGGAAAKQPGRGRTKLNASGATPHANGASSGSGDGGHGGRIDETDTASYRGVVRRSHFFVAQCKHHNRYLMLGHFQEASKAAAAYDLAVVERDGEARAVARLNFPDRMPHYVKLLAAGEGILQPAVSKKQSRRAAAIAAHGGSASRGQPRAASKVDADAGSDGASDIEYWCDVCKDDTVKPCMYCGCKICKTKRDFGSILLCDNCDGEYHFNCLVPPLPHVPTGDWFCHECVAAGITTAKRRGSRRKQTKVKASPVASPVRAASSPAGSPTAGSRPATLVTHPAMPSPARSPGRSKRGAAALAPRGLRSAPKIRAVGQPLYPELGSCHLTVRHAAPVHPDGVRTLPSGAQLLSGTMAAPIRFNDHDMYSRRLDESRVAFAVDPSRHVSMTSTALLPEASVQGALSLAERAAFADFSRAEVRLFSSVVQRGTQEQLLQLRGSLSEQRKQLQSLLHHLNHALDPIAEEERLKQAALQRDAEARATALAAQEARDAAQQRKAAVAQSTQAIRLHLEQQLQRAVDGAVAAGSGAPTVTRDATAVDASTPLRPAVGGTLVPLAAVRNHRAHSGNGVVASLPQAPTRGGGASGGHGGRSSPPDAAAQGSGGTSAKVHAVRVVVAAIRDSTQPVPDASLVRLFMSTLPKAPADLGQPSNPLPSAGHVEMFNVDPSCTCNGCKVARLAGVQLVSTPHLGLVWCEDGTLVAESDAPAGEKVA